MLFVIGIISKPSPPKEAPPSHQTDTRRQLRLMCKPQCTPPHPTEQPRPGAPPSCVAEYATTSHENRIGFLLFAGSRQPVGSPGRLSLLRTHVSLRRRIDSKRGTSVAPCTHSRCPAQIKAVSGPFNTGLCEFDLLFGRLNDQKMRDVAHVRGIQRLCVTLFIRSIAQLAQVLAVPEIHSFKV